MVVHTDNVALKYLLTKKDSKPILIRWILLLQEFDVEIRDKKSSEKLVADHLSRIAGVQKGHDVVSIRDTFTNEQLLAISHKEEKSEEPWFVDIVNFLACEIQLEEMTRQQLKCFFHECKFYY